MSLNLTKGQTINLNKESGKTLKKIRIGAGWDPCETKGDFDLDLWLIPKGGEACYFNNMKISGASLDKDDTTGKSSDGGADENVHIDVASLEKDEYTIMVNIFEAKKRGQFFSDVEGAFVEIEDEEDKKIIASYKISENGGSNTELVFGKLTRKDDGFEFSANSEFSTLGNEELVKKLS